MRHVTRFAAAALGAALLFSLPAQARSQDESTAAEVTPRHAIAMHGTPKYGPDFTHFDYVNPDAPKGGTLKRYAIGTFDSFNPFIVKGTPPRGVGLSYDTLLTASADEPFTEYGLIADSVEVPEDRSWIIFNLRKEARFHDGEPITAEDVVWSFNTLRKDGAPFYRFYYANVADVTALADDRVKFSFKGGTNRELPLILGQLPVLPKHWWDGRDFTDATLDVPLGSGPYRVADFEPGRYVVYERVKDWWGADLPVSRGVYNFDRLRYEYFRDTTVALEAFKAGAYDLREENTSKLWATGYDFPARTAGDVILGEFEHSRTAPIQGFIYNLRRPLFQDRTVRAALAYAFDFPWTNANLFYGQYTRTRSFFDNSELAATGLPSDDELALLEPLRGQLPDEVFTTAYAPPTTSGDITLRDNLRTAMTLLREAGWQVKDGVLTHGETGRPFRFEILLSSPVWERVSNPFVRNLKRLGIEATIRTVDSAQYQNRMATYDYDMTVAVWGQSLSPGNEQREFWGSEAAELEGSRNYTGLQNPAIDALIDKVISAENREALVTATRALDRALQWQHILIPHWHTDYDRIAYWNKFGIPEHIPLQGVQPLTWWADPGRAGAVKQAQGEQQ